MQTGLPAVFCGPTLVPLYTLFISIVLNLDLLLSPLPAIPESADMMLTTQPLTLSLAANPKVQLPPITNKQTLHTYKYINRHYHVMLNK